MSEVNESFHRRYACQDRVRILGHIASPTNASCQDCHALLLIDLHTLLAHVYAIVVPSWT